MKAKAPGKPARQAPRLDHRRRRLAAIVSGLLALFVVVLALLLLNSPSGRFSGAGAGGGGSVAAYAPPAPVRSAPAPAPVGPVPAPVVGAAMDLAQLVDSQGPAVVLIALFSSGGEIRGIGSGFIVDPAGLVVTNHHVVDPRFVAANVRVRLNSGKFISVRSVVASDPARDLAVLALDAGGLPTVKLGNSDTVRAGQKIAVIGHPRGLTNTVSDGIVSAVRTLPDGIRLLQISAPISPGNSGGPVFDLSGAVIAVTRGYLPGGQNLNFAVAINEVRPLLQKATAAAR